MAMLTGIKTTQDVSAGNFSRGWPMVVICVTLLSLAGWSYLVAMLADMIPVMDMGEAGPGMSLFNSFNQFAGLPKDIRAALAVLCLPAGATFGMPGPDMTLADLGHIFLMWSMMALAMMLPTAIPMLRAYHLELAGRAQTSSATEIEQGRVLPVLFAAAGYLSVWILYALAATAAQWVLSRLGALNGMLAPLSLSLTASVLLAAGLYQFTAAKRLCLQRCWHPRWVFASGAGLTSPSRGLREGFVQGRVCLGCCWAVMTVMFAVGLMNVLWIALLGGLMAIEKTFPSRLLRPAIGIAFLAWAGGLVTLIVTGQAQI
jgi:predicted metal-binding membrane protein